jgi:uncharacterized membrane protein YkoI
MFSITKKTLLAFASVAALAAGGATFAGAATKSTSSSSSSRHAPETALTGDTAAKVKAAAEAKVPGGTVLRIEQGGPGGAAYHAHVRKADGSEVVVLVNSSFEATSVEMGPAGRDGRGDHGRRGPGGDRGRGRETALIGDTAAKVKAAAEARVPGGTVLRVENDADSSSPYEAHVRKADGTEVVVLVNSSFEATSVASHSRP